MDRSTWFFLKEEIRRRTGALEVRVSGNKLILQFPKMRVAFWPIKPVSQVEAAQALVKGSPR